MDKLKTQIREVADLIKQSEKVLVFTGAGVSTESGIPDFRGADGIWNKYDPEDFTIQRFMSDKRARKLHWDLLSDGDLSMFKADLKSDISAIKTTWYQISCPPHPQAREGCSRPR